jgi:16S rRNA (uracil1498-N3)-methyltransferase
MSADPLSTTPRLYLDQPLSAGAEVAATDAQAHYLRQVMRRASGDPVRLFNGRDGEWAAEVRLVGKKGVALAPTRQTQAQDAAAQVTLAFAPLKAQRLDMLIEKATELGVGVLAPVITARTIVTKVKDERLRTIAIEAAEQCERTTVPEIAPAMSWDAFVAHLRAAQGTRVYFMDEAGARDGSASPVTAMCPNVPALIVVGPEGGFTPDEASALRAVPGAMALRLGPRILRAETAAIAALAAWQALAGDWRG